MLKKLAKFIKNPDARWAILTSLGLTRWVPDRLFLQKEYKLRMKKPLNLDTPQTFNEKLQWLKLFDRNPAYTEMVDKIAVKKYVAERIGKEYVIPTLGIWDRFEDIDFQTLPDRFVLKCSHDSGGLVICRDKSRLDIRAARKKLNRYLKRKYYYIHREWPYKNVPPRILAEPYMEDQKTGELRDYKFFTFNGKVKLLFISASRQTAEKETTFDFFDMDYRHLDFKNGHPNAAVLPEKPQNFDEMKKLAEVLARDIPFVRVDFYECDGKTYFGEMTFYPRAGYMCFEPEEWNDRLGKMLVLPK